MLSDSIFGSVVSGRDVGPQFHVSADVVVVGLGSGGAVALRELARAGLRAVGVEVGSSVRKSERTDIRRASVFAESGYRATHDGSVRMHQGRGVGGSTNTNARVCRRLPRQLLERWERDHGVVLPGLRHDFDAIEEMLRVRPIAESEINRNNALLWRGIRSLGYRGGPLFRPDFSDPLDPDANLGETLIRPALEAGALVLTDARVDRVLHSDGRATAVIGTLIDPAKVRPVGDFTISARVVLLASSALGTAALALRSRIPDPHAHIGTRLRLHPRAVVLGYYDEDVRMWDGASQSIECSEFLDTEPDAAERTWLVGDTVLPAEAATLIPNFGPKHSEQILRLAQAAAIRVVVRDGGNGNIQPGSGEHVRVNYSLAEEDAAALSLGLREAARIHLAAGAQEVFVPLGGGLTIRGEDQLGAILPSQVRAFSPPLTSTNPTSTMPMGTSPQTGAVDIDGCHHYIRNLFVADGSLFPTAIGVPLLLPVTALALRVARAVTAHLADNP